MSKLGCYAHRQGGYDPLKFQVRCMRAYRSAARVAIGACISLPLAACHSFFVKESTPISIKEGLALVERDLAQASPVVLPDLAKNPGGAVAPIFNAQCLNNLADPPVAVIAGAISVALTGTFTTTPSAQISWTGTGPGAQLGFQVSVAQAQALTIPVTFVSARALPNFYLGQNLANLAGFDPKDPEKAKLVADIVTTHDALEPIVAQAIADYPGNKAKCPATLDKVGTSPVIPQLTFNVSTRQQ